MSKVNSFNLKLTQRGGGLMLEKKTANSSYSINNNALLAITTASNLNAASEYIPLVTQNALKGILYRLIGEDRRVCDIEQSLPQTDIQKLSDIIDCGNILVTQMSQPQFVGLRPSTVIAQAKGISGNADWCDLKTLWSPFIDDIQHCFQTNDFSNFVKQYEAKSKITKEIVDLINQIKSLNLPEKWKERFDPLVIKHDITKDKYSIERTDKNGKLKTNTISAFSINKTNLACLLYLFKKHKDIPAIVLTSTTKDWVTSDKKDYTNRTVGAVNYYDFDIYLNVSQNILELIENGPGTANWYNKGIVFYEIGEFSPDDTVNIKDLTISTKNGLLKTDK